MAILVYKAHFRVDLPDKDLLESVGEMKLYAQFTKKFFPQLLILFEEIWPIPLPYQKTIGKSFTY